MAWDMYTLKEDSFFLHFFRAQFSHLLKQEYECMPLAELLRYKMSLPKTQLLHSTCISSFLQGSRYTQRGRIQFLSSCSSLYGAHNQQ